MLQYFDYHMRIRAKSRGEVAREPGAAISAYDLGLDFELFASYFQALGAAIPAPSGSQDRFVQALRRCFGLTAQRPAPPVTIVRKGVLARRDPNGSGHGLAVTPVAAPRALQHHGDCIAWSQTSEGMLESEERALDSNQGRKLFGQSLSRNFNTDVILWKRREDNLACETCQSMRCTCYC